MAKGRRRRRRMRSRREFPLCRVNWGVVTGKKECLYCLFFLVKFFVKGVDIFDEVVVGCGFSDIL